MSKNNHPAPAAKTEVAVKQPTEIAAPMKSPDWAEGILNSDVPAPRLLCGQPISKAVAEGRVPPGSFFKSATDEVIAKRDEVFTIIPLKVTNMWINKELVGQKYEYRSMESRNVINENYEWDYEDEVTHIKWKRVKALVLYALLPKDVTNYNAEMDRAAAEGTMPDLSKVLMPSVITFQSTSFNTAAKPLTDFYTRLQDTARDPRFAHLKPYQFQLELSSKLGEKQSKGTYFTQNIGKYSEVKDVAVLKEAKKWFEFLSANELKVDDSGDDGEEVPSVSTSNLV